MPQSLNISDFSAGWCPSDDPINGRKNGLLKMDALELDQNGAIRMSGGSNLLFTYTADAHTIYSKFLKDAQYRYVTLTNGTTYRNTTSIKTGGSATRSGFTAAFDFVIGCSGSKRFRDDGTTVTDLGVTKPSAAPTTATDGAGILTGDYNYVQVNVTASGAYIAKSPASAEATLLTTLLNQVKITPTAPGGSVTEVWHFRKGNTLDQYYRIARVTSSLSTAFDDNMSDQMALDIGITLSLLSLTVNSTDLPDDILEVVGPVNSRIIYFTKNSINFSEVNSPDSYIPGQSIQYAGGTTGAEIFLFARKISENAVMIGTTHGFYLLSGTYLTLPDGTLDVYLRNLNVQDAPISIDADIYNGSVVCMTATGWKLTNPGGSLQNPTGYQIPLVDEKLDRLYRGETLQGYGGVPIYILPQYRYSCCISRDKLYVRVPQIVNNDPLQTFTYRMEVYDFKRKYWRALPDFNPLMLYAQEDDAVIGFFDTSHTLRDIDNQFTKQNNGVNQTVHLLTPVLTFEKPQTRKDFYTIAFKISTGGSNVTFNFYINAGQTLIYTYTANTGSLADIILDLQQNITANEDLQIEITGQAIDFLLTTLTISLDFRPDPITSLILIAKPISLKRRIRSWPFKLDTRGRDITVTPTVDGVDLSTTTLSHADVYEKTHVVFFKNDVFGKDFKFKLNAVTGSFEFYEFGLPEVVETLPIAKQFDQLGPVEIFRYGNLIELEVILIAFGGTTIPYAIYLDDVIPTGGSGNLTVTDGKQGSFNVPLPKNIDGTILRIELGPTAFDFHRFYGRVRVQKSGRDTDRQWITIGQTQEEQVS